MLPRAAHTSFALNLGLEVFLAGGAFGGEGRAGWSGSISSLQSSRCGHKVGLSWSKVGLGLSQASLGFV